MSITYKNEGLPNPRMGVFSAACVVALYHFTYKSVKFVTAIHPKRIGFSYDPKSVIVTEQDKYSGDVSTDKYGNEYAVLYNY